MKIKTTQSALKDALAKIADVVPARPSLPVLSNVKITGRPDGKGAVIVASDGNMTVTTEIECEVESPSTAVASYRLLYGIVANSMSGDILIDTDKGGKMNVQTPTGRFSVAMVAEELYPKSATEDGERRVVVSCDDMAAMLSRVMHAIGRDETRKALQHMLVEVEEGVMRTVATNGTTLALATATPKSQSGEGGMRFAVPDAACRIVQKLLGYGDNIELSIPKSKKYAVFTIGRTKVQTRLYDGEYPNYTQVIPTDETRSYLATVSTDFLDAALKRVSVFLSDETKSVRCTFDGDSLEVSARGLTGDDAKESLATTNFDGKEFRIFFDASKLAKAVSSSGSNGIDMLLYGELKPVKLKGEGGYVAVIMPLRIQ